MNDYRIFKRKWWKDNPSWPDELEPHPTARKTTICYVSTEEEAQEICEKWNRINDPGRYSMKAEYQRE